MDLDALLRPNNEDKQDNQNQEEMGTPSILFKRLLSVKPQDVDLKMPGDHFYKGQLI